MKIIRLNHSGDLAIPVDKIDCIKLRDAFQGRAIVVIKNCGEPLTFEFDTMEQARKWYEELVDFIEEL